MEDICRQIGEDFEKYILPALCEIETYEDFLELRTRKLKRYQEKEMRILRYYHAAQQYALEQGGSGHGLLVELRKELGLCMKDIEAHLEWLDVCRECSHFTKVDAREIALRAARA